MSKNVLCWIIFSIPFMFLTLHPAVVAEYDMLTDPNFICIPEDANNYYDSQNYWYHFLYATSNGPEAERFIYKQIPQISGDFRLEYKIFFVTTGYAVRIGLNSSTVEDDFIALQWYEQNYGSGDNFATYLTHDGVKMNNCYKKFWWNHPENTGYHAVMERIGSQVFYEVWNEEKTTLICSASYSLDYVDAMNYFFIQCYGAWSYGDIGEAMIKMVKIERLSGEPPETSERIIYHSDRAGSTDIWMCDPNGNNHLQLTNRPGKEYYARLSPDGKEILYAYKTTNSPWSIWIVNIDGSDDRQIDVGKEASPTCWSPDGTKILYFHHQGRWRGRMCVVNKDGTNDIVLLEPFSPYHTQVDGLDWKNGKILFYTSISHSGNNRIYIMNEDTTNITQLTYHHGDLGRFNYDATKISYFYGSSINVMNVDGSNDYTVLTGVHRTGRIPFSPAGTELAFAGFTHDAIDNDIYKINLDGTNLTRLTYSEDVHFVVDWVNIKTNTPPVAVCKDIEIPVDNNCQATITAEDIDGGSHDPDDDEIILSVDISGPFSIGEHFVNLTVKDSKGASDSCQGKVTVVDNIAPIPDVMVLPTVTGECSAEIITVPTAIDNCAGTITGTTNDPLIYSNQGTYFVTWTFDDGRGNIATQKQKVIVKDTTVPNIENMTAIPNVLWPPNHKMVQVAVSAIVSDNCDTNPVTKILSVTSNEPVNGTGDGDTAPDWEITGDLTVNLRAERSGNGNGRIYTITVESTDASGNRSTQDLTVTVPHNKKKME